MPTAKEFFITVDFVQRNQTVGENPGMKFRPQIHRRETIQLNAIIDNIVANEGMTEGDVYNAISAFLKVVEHYFALGHPVKLGDLGTFSPAIKAKNYNSLQQCKNNWQADTKISSIFYPSSKFKTFLEEKVGLTHEDTDITGLQP
ncbi:MAG: HU family DNA-binding protein [Bacteroidales bacterium]|jgi:predicted histone-like DNA-binding protein|nr:HU family DNA-binding protein [Bacteroidales bacterium]